MTQRSTVILLPLKQLTLFRYRVSGSIDCSYISEVQKTKCHSLYSGFKCHGNRHRNDSVFSLQNSYKNSDLQVISKETLPQKAESCCSHFHYFLMLTIKKYIISCWNTIIYWIKIPHYCTLAHYSPECQIQSQILLSINCNLFQHLKEGSTGRLRFTEKFNISIKDMKKRAFSCQQNSGGMSQVSQTASQGMYEGTVRHL